MRGLAIIGLCVLAAVVFGIVHDQITARVCVEYFTIGHPDIFLTEDPTLLGLGWGIVATWWVGLILGVALAVAARGGSRSKRSVRSLFRPIGLLLAVMATCAALAGLVGCFLARAGVVYLVGPLASRVPNDRQVAFLADLWAHSASYAAGFIGGVIVVVLVWRSRGQKEVKGHLR